MWQCFTSAPSPSWCRYNSTDLKDSQQHKAGHSFQQPAPGWLFSTRNLLFLACGKHTRSHSHTPPQVLHIHHSGCRGSTLRTLPSSHHYIPCNFSPGISIARSQELKGFEFQLESCVCAGGLGAWPQLQGAAVSIVLFCNVHLHAVFQMFHVSQVLATNQAETSAEDLVLYVCADLPLLHWFKIKLVLTIWYLSQLKETC